METEKEQRPGEENGGPVLEIEELTKRFGATLALNKVSLELGRNEVLALLGDNGAGKSTRSSASAACTSPMRAES